MIVAVTLFFPLGVRLGFIEAAALFIQGHAAATFGGKGIEGIGDAAVFHGSVEGIVGIPAHQRTCHHDRQVHTHCRHTAARHTGTDREEISLRAALHRNVSGFHGVLHTDGRPNGGKADGYQRIDTYRRRSGSGQGHNSGYQAIVVLCLHRQIAGGANGHIASCQGFGTESQDDHIQRAAHTGGTAAGHARRVTGYKLARNSDHFHAAIARLQQGLVQNLGQGLVFKIGDHSHCGDRCGTGGCHTDTDVQQLAIVISPHTDGIGPGDVAAQRSLGAVHKYQCVHITGHSGAAGGSKGHGQQIQGTLIFGGHGNSTAGIDTAGVSYGSLDVLIEYADHHGCAYAHAASGTEGTGKLHDECIVRGING